MRLTVRTITISLIFLLMIAFTPLLLGEAAHAETVKLNIEKAVFDDGKDASYFRGVWPEKEFYGDNLVSATSSDTNVATVEISDVNPDSAYIEPVHAGSCTVDLEFENGDTASLPVTVKKSWFKWYLKKSTNVTRLQYGSKTVKIESLPGTTGTVTVAKKTYKFKVNSKGKASVKVKKIYKLKTKFKFKFKNSKLDGKPSFTKTLKLKSGAFFYKADRLSSKKIEVDISDLTKGDKVKLVYKGKTYTIKITKKNVKGHLKFKLKNKIPKKDTTFKLKVVNKYKQSLLKQTFILYDGETTEPDDDLEEDEE